MIDETKIASFRMPRWNELPSMPIYLEQVLTLVDEYINNTLSQNGEKLLTKTMINNYVKHQYIEAPVNKKYSKAAVASLLAISVLKPSFTIEEICKLIATARISFDTPKAYDLFCSGIEQAIHHAFQRTTMPRLENPDDPRDLIWNVCNACAAKIFVNLTYMHNGEEAEGA